LISIHKGVPMVLKKIAVCSLFIVPTFLAMEKDKELDSKQLLVSQVDSTIELIKKQTYAGTATNDIIKTVFKSIYAQNDTFAGDLRAIEIWDGINTGIMKTDIPFEQLIDGCMHPLREKMKKARVQAELNHNHDQLVDIARFEGSLNRLADIFKDLGGTIRSLQMGYITEDKVERAEKCMRKIFISLTSLTALSSALTLGTHLLLPPIATMGSMGAFTALAASAAAPAIPGLVVATVLAGGMMITITAIRNRCFNEQFNDSMLANAQVIETEVSILFRAGGLLLTNMGELLTNMQEQFNRSLDLPNYQLASKELDTLCDERVVTLEIALASYL
jgi:hypothetical protein